MIGLAYSWKEIYVSNLHELFPETRLEDVDLSKTQPCKLKTQPQITLGPMPRNETVHSIVTKLTGEKRGARNFGAG